MRDISFSDIEKMKRLKTKWEVVKFLEGIGSGGNNTTQGGVRKPNISDKKLSIGDLRRAFKWKE